MAFKKGESGNPAGKPKGTASKLTIAAREAFQRAFDEVGGVRDLATWAKENRTEFYKLYGKLIPIQVTGEGDGPLKIEIVRFADRSPS